MFFDEGLAGVHLKGIQWVHLGNFRDETRFQVDDVVIWAMWGKLFMGFFGEDILEVSASFREGGFRGFSLLGDLSQDGEFPDGFSGEPGFPFSKASSRFEIHIHPQPS